ncbi:40S ribosomal protein SA [Pteropus alecto]|uniref:40S ribosomal protein SA n=1 Tax=Pteropus alecto TaxID=9402 RepID=L5K364_PTEAL|nr:40S ribosomal protein SA [Pteropus alecto]
MIAWQPRNDPRLFLPSMVSHTLLQLSTTARNQTKNLQSVTKQSIYKRKSDCIYIINLKRTWEKLLLAACAIVAIENPADVSVISSKNTCQRTVLKFAAATGATPIAGRFTPGTFTNQIQGAFPGAETSGSHQSQGQPSASHRSVLC